MVSSKVGSTGIRARAHPGPADLPGLQQRRNPDPGDERGDTVAGAETYNLAKLHPKRTGYAVPDKTKAEKQKANTADDVKKDDTGHKNGECKK